GLTRVTESRLYHWTMTRRPPQEAAADEGQGAKAPEIQEHSKIVSKLSDALGPGGLGDFQVIVLGRDAEAFLTDEVQTQLRSWLVQRGGALVCYRGQPVAQLSQRLAQLLPVRWTPMREARIHWNLTERGRDMHWLPP